MKYVSEEQYIVGWRHLACSRELAEGEQSFHARFICDPLFSHRAQCETALRLSSKIKKYIIICIYIYIYIYTQLRSKVYIPLWKKTTTFYVKYFIQVSTK